MIRSAKNDYINALLHDNGGTPNAMWKTLKLISSSKKDCQIKLEVNGEEVTDAEEVAQHFHNYFIDAVDRMFNPLNFIDGASEQSSYSDINYVGGIVPPDISFDLPVVTDEFVLTEINRISVKKATGPDEVSAKY